MNELLKNDWWSSFGYLIDFPLALHFWVETEKLNSKSRTTEPEFEEIGKVGFSKHGAGASDVL